MKQLRCGRSDLEAKNTCIQYEDQDSIEVVGATAPSGCRGAAAASPASSSIGNDVLEEDLHPTSSGPLVSDPMVLLATTPSPVLPTPQPMPHVILGFSQEPCGCDND